MLLMTDAKTVADERVALADVSIDIDILYWLKYICMFIVISIQCGISVQVGIRIHWEYITDICEYIFY